MFNFNSIIDTVQGAKTQFLDTFVIDKTVRSSLQEIVNAQTDFAKVANKNIQNVITKSTEELAKFDVKSFTFAK